MECISSGLTPLANYVAGLVESDYSYCVGYGLTVGDATNNLLWQCIGRTKDFEYTLVQCSCKQAGCPLRAGCQKESICYKDLRFQVEYTKLETGVFLARIAIPKGLM